MNYKKTITSIVLIAGSVLVTNAQTEGVSIKSTVGPPDASAMLDVQSLNKGVLIPRVNLMSLSDNSTVPNPALSLLVYCLGTATGGLPAGYYYNSSATTTPAWIKVSGSGDDLWTLAINKTDIYRNTGNIGIGTITPSYKIHLKRVNANDINSIGMEDAYTGGGNETNMFSVEAGDGAGRLVSDKSIATFIDSDNNSTDAIFELRHDEGYYSGPSGRSLFKVDEWGHFWFGDETSNIRPDLIFGTIVAGAKGHTVHEMFGPWSSQANGDPGSFYIDCGSSSDGSKNNFYIYDGSAYNTKHDFSCGTINLFSDNTYVSGNLVAHGTVSPSDSTLKTNIVTIGSSLNKLKQIRPVNFNWKTGNTKTQTGFIAQEVEHVFPELVSSYILPSFPNQPQSTVQKLSVDYVSFIPHLVKAIQEQEVLIEQLQQQNALIQQQNTLLSNRIQALENK